jgi:hypothetical protein
LSKKFSQYVKHLKLFKFVKEDASNEAKQKEFEPFDYLINTIHDMLIKTSSLEIVNSIENHFYSGFSKELDFNMSKSLLEPLKYTDKQNVNLYIRCISTLLDSFKDVLEYINTNKPYSDILIQSIYLYNFDLYEQILQLIYENWKYYKVEILEKCVEFDLTQFKFRDENLDVLKYVIKNRPCYLKEVIDILNSSISRHGLLSLLVDSYDSLKSYVDLTFDESIEVASKNPDALLVAYQKINTPEERDKFYSLIKGLDDSSILRLLRQNDEYDLVFYIITHKQLKGELKDFIKEKYLPDSRYVYKLLIYCDKNEILQYVPRYLVDRNSMISFLIVLKPTDILTYALSMEDIKSSMRIIDLSFENNTFNENDFIYALNTSVQTLPPLLMRLLILTFKKYPHLKSFVVSFLYNLISKDAVEKENYFIGFIKCLEMLDITSIDILAALPERNIVNILSRSRLLCKLCKDNVFRRDLKFKRDVNILRHLIRDRF